jgi:hypothetical protein
MVLASYSDRRYVRVPPKLTSCQTILSGEVKVTRNEPPGGLAVDSWCSVSASLGPLMNLRKRRFPIKEIAIEPSAISRIRIELRESGVTESVISRISMAWVDFSLP